MQMHALQTHMLRIVAIDSLTSHHFLQHLHSCRSCGSSLAGRTTCVFLTIPWFLPSCMRLSQHSLWLPINSIVRLINSHRLLKPCWKWSRILRALSQLGSVLSVATSRPRGGQPLVDTQPQYSPWRAKPSRMPRAISASVSTTRLFWGCLTSQSTSVGCALPTTIAGLAPAQATPRAPLSLASPI